MLCGARGQPAGEEAGTDPRASHELSQGEVFEAALLFPVGSPFPCEMVWVGFP